MITIEDLHSGEKFIYFNDQEAVNKLLTLKEEFSLDMFSLMNRYNISCRLDTSKQIIDQIMTA